MAESTLSIVWQELEARVGSYLGWGRGAFYGDLAWTNYQQFELDGIVSSALRQFYFPKAQEGRADSYDWSFLKPLATLTLPSGASTINLPDDFGGFEDVVTLLTSGSTAQPWRIEWRNEGSIRQMYSVSPTMTGPPMYASGAIPLKGTTTLAGQRSQMMFFPLADQQYSLQVRYYINPDCLSAPFPYAYGGAEHSETIYEGCLAMAEQRLDDTMGLHTAMFAERLQASVSMDRRKKPQKLGYNGDRSDQVHEGRPNVHYSAPAATYNGASFG